MRHQQPRVRGYAVTHPPGEVRLPTRPGWHQVLYTRSGSLVARTNEASWTVPPHRALCLADGSTVRVRTARPTAVRCLYLATSLASLSAEVAVVHVGDLARELLLHAVEHSPLDLDDEADAALVTLLVAHLGHRSAEELQLPLPHDDRARALAEAILRDPSLTLADHVAVLPASRRTIERRFRHETSLSPAAWQRRARVLASIERLDDRTTVAEVGASLGFSTGSAFVAAFRAELGTTPRALGRVARHGPLPARGRHVISLVAP